MPNQEMSITEVVISRIPAESLPIIIIVLVFGYYFMKYTKETKQDYNYVTKDELQLSLLTLKTELIDRITNVKRT